MRTINRWGISVVAVVALSGSTAFAKVDTSSGVVTPLPKAITLADNVVVTPSQPAPVLAAPPTQVQVQPVQQVAAVPVAPQRTVVTEDHPRNIMATITVSALLGAIAGALIGGAIYYLDTPREHPARIGYWAAGGVLVGTGIGIVNVVVDQNRSERAVGARLPSDPVPTYRLSLLNTSF